MAQPLPRHQRHAERAADLDHIAHIILTTGGEPPKATTHKKRNATGDTRILRMIPITAKGVGGTIPGTEGCSAVIAKEARHTA